MLRVGCEKWMMTEIGALNPPYPVSRTTDTATGVHTGDIHKIFLKSSMKNLIEIRNFPRSGWFDNNERISGSEPVVRPINL